MFRSRGRDAGRKPFQRSVPAGKISAAREHQDAQHRRLRRASHRAAARARWKQRVCCRRKSTWPSSSACARSSKIPSIRSGGCRMTCEPEVLPELSQGARSRRESTRGRSAEVFFRSGRCRYRRSFRTSRGTSANSGAANASFMSRVPKAEFDEVMQQVERWGLDQHLKEAANSKSSFRQPRS